MSGLWRISEAEAEEGIEKGQMKTIKLTPKDEDELLFALGYAQGASGNKDGKSKFTSLTDRILVQLSKSSYTYGKPRQEVEKELMDDGIFLQDNL